MVLYVNIDTFKEVSGEKIMEKDARISMYILTGYLLHLFGVYI